MVAVALSTPTSPATADTTKQTLLLLPLSKALYPCRNISLNNHLIRLKLLCTPSNHHPITNNPPSLSTTSTPISVISSQYNSLNHLARTNLQPVPPGSTPKLHRPLNYSSSSSSISNKSHNSSASLRINTSSLHSPLH